MWYEYRCDVCGFIHETQQCMPIGQYLAWCSQCPSGQLQRIVSMPQVRGTAEPYYNHSVGAWVKDDTDLRRQLKAKARDNSNLTGMDHSYEPVYPSDMKAMSLPESEAIEHSRRNNPDAYKPSTSKVIY